MAQLTDDCFAFSGPLMAVDAVERLIRERVTPVAEVYVQAEPPPPRVEVIPPAPAPAMVWVPGFWDWNGSAYVWIDGRYVVADAGYVWVRPRYAHRAAGVVYVPGYWWHSGRRERVYGHDHFRAAPRHHHHRRWR